jgi:hypothetical protein
MSRASTDVHRATTSMAAGRRDGGTRTDPARARVLSRSTVMMLRRVLHAYRDGWLLEERLATAARMVVEDARLHRLPAAGMLLSLDREWAELAEVRVLGAGDRHELLDRLVTLCIGAWCALEPAIHRHAHVVERRAA